MVEQANYMIFAVIETTFLGTTLCNKMSTFCIIATSAVKVQNLNN